MQPLRPQKHGGPGRSSSRGHGSGLWPHSPAIALGPVEHLAAHHDARADAGAEDHAEHDLARPRRAPSVASESAKQLASLRDPHLAAEQRFEIAP